tara:strand:+ start:64 stop:612 length:549 start_codon:yes stop_codon:yes gene_type:complete
MKLHAVPEKLKAIRCQHVSLEVSNVDESLIFYREFLGMKLSERHPAGEHRNIPFEMAFLRLNNRHHDLVLTHDPKRKYIEKSLLESAAGIHHFAFECPSRNSFLSYLSRAKEMNLKIVRGPVIHSSFHKDGDGTWGENESFYVLDPDGHRVEIFCDMASITDEGKYVNAYNMPVPDIKAEEI